MGLDGRKRGPGVAYVPPGRDSLVLHDKGHATSNYHFGFLVDSPSTVDKWRAWFRSRRIIIQQDTTDDKYRSIKIGDPDGYWIEITYDGRTIPWAAKQGSYRVPLARTQMLD